MSVVANTKQKVTSLQAVLAKDLAASDLKWTLFVAAAQTYRYDSRLTPYPSRCAPSPELSSEKVDIEAIRRSIDAVPDLRSIRWQDLTDATVDLMHWVLCEQSENTVMQSVRPEQFEEVLSKVGSKTPEIKPTHIIELIPTAESPAENKFRSHLIDHDSLFAYHGSKIDSFHSITSHGLQQHLCKTNLFGDGIYLSSEMHVSVSFSQVNVGWKHSLLGSEISCIALCEFVDHPVHLKRHATEKTNNVPEKYFVITNNDIVRVRYLLVFGEAGTSNITSITHNPMNSAILNRPPSRLRRFVTDNKAMITIVVYSVMLLMIGLFNSRTGQYWRHVFWTKVEKLVDEWMWSPVDQTLVDGVQWPIIRSPTTADL